MKKGIEKKLVKLEKEYSDEDSVSIIHGWRDSLNQIEFDKAYANLKNTKELIEAARNRVLAVDAQLLERRKMSAEDREYLLGIKDSMKTLVFWLDPKDYDSREKAITAEIERSEKGELET